MEVLSKSTKDTKELARILAEKLSPNTVIAMYGDLGSGKTTFTAFLVEALEIPARVQSPTFVIARKYSGGKGQIKIVNHLDLYRIEDKADLQELDLEDYFSEPDSITIIEWPQLVEEFLPENVIKINFESVSENERKINVQNFN